jgi:hypothetical protein
MEKITKTLTDFISVIEIREKKDIISVSRTINPNKEITPIVSKYQLIDGYSITENERRLDFYIKVLDKNFLQVAIIHDIIIAMDLRDINEACERNIVNYQTNFVITKTMASFLNNKIWAWLDRGRKIWQKEF